MTRKKILILFLIVITVILIAVSIIILGKAKGKEDIPATKGENDDTYVNTSGAIMKAVIIRAESDYLGVMELGNYNALLRVNLNNFNYDGFKMGQEILVYYDGFVLESFPGQINNIEKIEITNEESNVQIPDEYFRVFNNSGENVEISISEITNNGIDLLIKDTNDLQYVYSNHYMIQKQVKNPNYTGVVQTLGENTSNSIAPAMRNRTRIYL
ncbi:MAG: hypothetical protein IJ629_05040 [Clostridia bacterium]|nr:hypothetical protein [Clostridia bacterium]